MAKGGWVPTVSGTLEYSSPQLAQLVFTCNCFTHCTHALHTCTHIYSQEAFCDNDIGSGHVLLQLCEEHMKEMGVKIVGHRLELLRQIDKLRNRAGFVSQATFIDTPTLLKQ